eukprot:403374844
MQTPINITTLRVPNTPQVQRKILHNLITDERMMQATGLRSPMVNQKRRDTLVSMGQNPPFAKQTSIAGQSQRMSNHGGGQIPRISNSNSVANNRRKNFIASSQLSMDIHSNADYIAPQQVNLQQNQEQINRNVRALKAVFKDQKKDKKKEKQKLENQVVKRKTNLQNKKTGVLDGGIQRKKTGKSLGQIDRKHSMSSIFTNNKSKNGETQSRGSQSSDEDDDQQFQNLKRRINRSTFKEISIMSLYAECIIEVFFYVDVFMCFNTGFYDKGVLIMNRKLIAKKYMHSTLIVDILSNLPINFLLVFKDFTILDHQTLNLIRVVKLFRIYKMGFFGQKIFDYIASDFLNLIVNFTKMMFNILLIAHWSACLFYFAGTVSSNEHNNTWLKDQGLIDTSDVEKYVNAMYFSITTMTTIGYGDIKPQNSQEYMIVCFLELLAGITFAYMIGKIGSLFQRYNLLAVTYKEKVQFVLQFLTLRNIPKELKLKIKRYLDYNLEMKKDLKIEEEEVYGFLNEDLKSKLTVFMNGKILKSVSVFSEFPLEFLSNLTFIFIKKSFSTEEYVFNEGDDGKDIYFITQGKVCLIHRQTYTYIIDLEKEQSFGEIGFFSDCQRQVTVKSRDYTDVLTVNLIDFLNIANTFSEHAITIYHKINSSIDTWKKDFSTLKIKCYICSSSKHISIDCPQFKNKMKGNIANFIKQQTKKGDTMDGSDVTQRTPHRYRSTTKMPVVSPALSRQITYKVRDELGAEDRLGNWRSIINLQPLKIERLSQFHHNLDNQMEMIEDYMIDEDNNINNNQPNFRDEFSSQSSFDDSGNQDDLRQYHIDIDEIPHDQPEYFQYELEMQTINESQDLQLAEIEEIKEENESLYSEHDDYTRTRRRGTLGGFDQGRAKYHKMKKESKNELSQQNLSQNRFKKSQTHLELTSSSFAQNSKNSFQTPQTPDVILPIHAERYGEVQKVVYKDIEKNSNNNFKNQESRTSKNKNSNYQSNIFDEEKYRRIDQNSESQFNHIEQQSGRKKSSNTITITPKNLNSTVKKLRDFERVETKVKFENDYEKKQSTKRKMGDSMEQQLQDLSVSSDNGGLDQPVSSDDGSSTMSYKNHKNKVFSKQKIAMAIKPIVGIKKRQHRNLNRAFQNDEYTIHEDDNSQQSKKQWQQSDSKKRRAENISSQNSKNKFTKMLSDSSESQYKIRTYPRQKSQEKVLSSRHSKHYRSINVIKPTDEQEDDVYGQSNQINNQRFQINSVGTSSPDNSIVNQLNINHSNNNNQMEDPMEFQFQNFVNFRITMADLENDDDTSSNQSAAVASHQNQTLLENIGNQERTNLPRINTGDPCQ